MLENKDEKWEDMRLEDAFLLVQQTVEKLEDSQISLEESFRLYEQGMKVLKHCNDCIDQVEKKVMMIQENGSLDEF